MTYSSGDALLRGDQLEIQRLVHPLRSLLRVLLTAVLGDECSGIRMNLLLKPSAFVASRRRRPIVDTLASINTNFFK